MNSCMAVRSCLPGSRCCVMFCWPMPPGTQRVLPYPDEALTAQNIQEGDTVALLPGRHAEKAKVYLTP